MGDRLLNNKITLKTWQKQTAQLLKILHTQQYLLGVGGEAQIRQGDYEAIASELLAQYQYLQNFALNLTQGKVSPPQFKVRLGMYASATKVSFYRGEKEAARRSGLDGARRILGATDHHCAQCLEYAARGVVPIDELVFPTQECQCRTNCLCSLVYVRLEDVINNSEFVDFAAMTDGYFVDKQGRWRDKRTGRFVDMPKNTPLTRRVINKINQSKLLELQGAAYNATLEKLKDEFKDNPEGLKIISDLGLEDSAARQRINTVIQALQDDAALTKEFTDKLGAIAPAKARAIVADIDKLKLVQLSGADAYKATVRQLRRKYKDDPDALGLINSLGVDGGVGKKAQLEARLERVRGLIKDEPPALKHSLRDIGVEPTTVNDAKIKDLEKQLNSVDFDSLSDGDKKQYLKDKAALDAVVKYQQSVKDLNDLVDEINNRDKLPQADYDRLYDERNRIWGEMKSALDESQGLKNTFLSNSALDDYIRRMNGVSRENPGGFKIVVPSSMDNLKARAVKSPC